MKVHELRQLTFFDGINLIDLQRLAPCFAPRFFGAGTTIFDQGDEASFLYLVAKGEVLIRYKPEDGPVMTVTHVQAGGVFGWSAAMGNRVYTSGAVSTTDCEVWCIRGIQLRKLCDNNPQVGSVILDRLAAVVAERQRHRQGDVTSILTSGIRSQDGRQGECKDDKY